MTRKQILHAFKESIYQNRQSLGGFLAFSLIVFSLVFVATKTTSVSNTVGDRELPIYCVETNEKKIALSFDAAWGNEDTSKILEILRKHDIHVTFFMTGGWVDSYPDDVKAILADGHDLGNHSQNHKDMTQLKDSEITSELMSVHDKVKELTGYEMFLFRPPYGAYDNHVVTDAKKLNYYTIQWDVETSVMEKQKFFSEKFFFNSFS
jgi:peptidoglycan/xylan/chitin deacetylase (PgdA/CDA1 family)